jgi:zinc/manganese transport system substrate-binding protein
MPAKFRLALLASLVLTNPAAAKLRVAASIQDLASIAASVGGEHVEAFAIARPTSDPHRVEALPSHMAKVARAQVFLKVGLGLDQWANAIVDGSRNPKLQLVDCSAGVHVLERPSGRVDASMGDVHPFGNPHYWLDPRNGAVVARNAAEAFARADPTNAAGYRERAEKFAREAQAAWEQASARAKAVPVRVLFTYHRSWSYFADAFGFEVVDTIEPVPGIPPTARHLADLVEQAKARGVKLLLQEPYFASDGGRFLERQAGVRPVIQATSCAEPVAGSYLRHFDEILGVLEQAR